MKNIIDILNNSINSNIENYSLVANVKSINKSDLTIEADPINGDAPVLDVKLVSETDNTNFVLIPELNSNVIITFTSKSTAFVSMLSKVSEVNIRGNQFGGLVKIDELTRNLDVITQRIDTIYNALNFAVPVPGDGGASLISAIKSTLSSQVIKEDFSNIENENVKHG